MKTKSILVQMFICTLFLLHSSTLSATSVPLKTHFSEDDNIYTGDATLQSQAEVDAFASNNYTEVTGNLNIGIDNAGVPTNIDDLSGLSSLTAVGGNLFINNTVLTELDGLENLVSVGEILSILRNEALVSLASLQHLTLVENIFAIVENPVLTNLNGLGNLTDLNVLVITDNPALTSITGISNIASNNGEIGFILIHTNTSLQSLVGLENITSLNGSLEIYDNNALTSLDGLDGLSAVTGLFLLADNPALNNINALANFNTAGFVVSLTRNNALTSLEGLENLASINNELFIQDNANLTDCCAINDLLNSGNVGGTINIGGNDSACDSQNAIENNCTDNDGDGFVDKDDCDDNDPSVNPAATEICDGKDNNCDGHIDEGLGGVFVGDVDLLTQAGLEAFALNCYSEITGDLTIGIEGGNLPSDINDLSSLRNLIHIDGDLNLLNNPLLASLTGFENINSIGGDLLVIRNSLLEDLSGLDNLTSIGGELAIVQNTLLRTLNGLNNVHSINGGFIYIYQNDALISLMGLENVTTVNGTLEISSNNALSSLIGLENISTVSGRLEIANNPALNDLSGLESITSVGSHLVIFNNDALTDLEGLNQVITVGGDLAIPQNDQLISLNGLEQVQTVGGGLYVNNNPILSDCCAVIDLMSGTGVNGPISFENNATACDSQTAVENNCIDNDGDGFVDKDDCDDNDPTINPAAPEICDGKDNNCDGFIDEGTGGIFEGDVTLFTQAGVDAFALNCYTGITGTLKIGTENGTFPTDITDLTALNKLNVIGRNLIIQNNPLLSNLNGLENISVIGYRVTIIQNDKLENLDALIGLSRINDLLQIRYNPALTNLDGLENVATIHGNFNINNNNSLTNLDGLGNVTIIDGDLYILTNPILSDCCAIQDLLNGSGISGIVDINNNASSCDSEAAIEADCSDHVISCDDITATTSGGTIHLSGLTAPTEIVKIYNSNWSSLIYQCSYSQDCGNELTITDLEPGDYNIHVQFFNPNCQKIIRVTVPENTCSIEVTGDVTCINNAGNISLNILDITYPVSSYTFAWSNGATTPVIGGLTPGTYTVVITNSEGCSETLSFIISETLCGGNCIDEDNDGYCDDNGEDCALNNPNLPTTPGTTCDDGDGNTENDVIQADGCTCAGTPIEEEFDCKNVDIQAGNASLTIGQLNTEYVVVKVYAPNWQLLHQCASWSSAGLTICDSPITITGLSEGKHHIQIQAYEGPWSNKFCSEILHVQVNKDTCLDDDNDGYCNEDDCSPNDANLPTTPGTPCDDGNPSTGNDEIQADGCSCHGTIDTGSNISLNCPNNITVSESAPNQGAVVYWDNPSATTDCPSINVQLDQTAGLPNNSVFEVGETTITYTATDECGSVATCSFVVTVLKNTGSEVPTDYCNARGTSPWVEWIKRVQFEAIDNDNNNKDRYGDYTNIQTDVVIGETYPISLTPGFSWTTYNEHWSVWIDFNRDGDFDDAGENVLEGSGTQVVVGAISIPTTADLGLTRMRIAMQRNQFAEACETFPKGEVEDYLVNLIPGSQEVRSDEIENRSENISFKTLAPIDFKLFPNPATDHLTVQLTAPVQEHTDLILYNYLGKAVYRQVIMPSHSMNLTIDLKGMETGLYLLSLQGSGQAALSKRLMVK